jgi:OFA family oxalate/formate antiporter-like MFS transporter
VHNGALFFILAAVVYLCYGGAFGTMPATAGDFFGVKYAGGIYGLMLVGWSIGGVVGPLIAAALIGANKNYSAAYTTIGIIALVAIILPVITRLPRVRRDAAEGELGSTSSQAARR